MFGDGAIILRLLCVVIGGGCGAALLFCTAVETREHINPCAGAGIVGLLRRDARSRPNDNAWLNRALHLLVLSGSVAISLQPLQNIAAADEPSPADLERGKLSRLDQFVYPRPSKPEPNPDFIDREKLLLLRYLG
jgi:hypothetical protein